MPALEAFISTVGFSLMGEPLSLPRLLWHPLHPAPPELLLVLAFARVSQGLSDLSHRSSLQMETLPGSIQSVSGIVNNEHFPG